MSRYALNQVQAIGGGRAIDMRRERLDYRTPLDWRGQPIVVRPQPPKVDISEIAARLIARSKANANSA